jgi:hypothetical protein
MKNRTTNLLFVLAALFTTSTLAFADTCRVETLSRDTKICGRDFSEPVELSYESDFRGWRCTWQASYSQVTVTTLKILTAECNIIERSTEDYSVGRVTGSGQGISMGGSRRDCQSKAVADLERKQSGLQGCR